MHRPTAVIALLLSLFGCDTATSSFEHRVVAGGRDVLHARAIARGGVARFDCLGSESGRCHFAVFDGTCEATPGIACRPVPTESFSLATGTSRDMLGVLTLPLCVSADGGQADGGCQPAIPAAWRKVATR